MRLSELKQFIEKLEKDYGPMVLDLSVDLMQESEISFSGLFESVQLQSALRDHTVSVGKKGPSKIVLIGKEIG